MAASQGLYRNPGSGVEAEVVSKSHPSLSQLLVVILQLANTHTHTSKETARAETPSWCLASYYRAKLLGSALPGP